MVATALTKEQREKLWAQFVTEHSKAQEDFDSSLRTLAGAGLGITVSLATALRALPITGLVASAFFLGALLLNLGSYVFVQLDMRARLNALTSHPADYRGAERSRWTTWTWLMNVGDGLALLAGGILLVVFIGRSV